MRKAGKFVGVILLLLVAALALAPISSSEESEGALPGITFEPYWDPLVIKMSAGDSETIELLIVNNSGGEIRISVMSFTYDNMDRVRAHSEQELIIPNNGNKPIIIKIVSEKYAPTETGKITVNFKASLTSGSTTDFTLSYTIDVSIDSIYSAGGAYNKVLGVWDSPFHDPLYTALLSFAIWLIVAFVISYLIAPTIIFLFIDEKKEERKGIRKAVAKPFVVLIALFGLAQCARIYGLEESSVATLTNIVNIAYICMGALIVWGIYKAMIRYIFHKKAERLMREESVRSDRDHHSESRDIIQNSIVDDSLIPLLDTMGKIFITVFAFASILAALGFDLMIIITSAGILGIAISLGAQNTISQFISGVTLMINRPFVPGDVVRVGTSQDVMRVKKVGLMATQFDDNNSNSTMTLPNNVVASSLITNITGKTSVYRVKPLVGVDYNTDVDVAMKLMVEAANEHPRAILDGSYSKPSARLESFEDSYIKLSVSVYVDDFEDWGSITGEIREIILRKFRENGIEIPFPQVDVNVKKE